MKRRSFLSALLALVLLLTLSTPAFAAKNQTKATTLRLEATSGAVTVTNAGGKTLKLADGAKLYNGYTVKTGAASYAWISLDDKSVIKTDASTTVTVKQSGKKLEVLLSKGNLFFNVSKPLAGDASLNIRTSNMSTGIRGTSGMISLRAEQGKQTIDAGQIRSTVTIFDGKVQVTYAAEEQTENAPAGEAAQLITTPVAAGQRAKIETTLPPEGAEQHVTTTAEVVTVNTADTIGGRGFVAEEVAGDAALQERIAAGSAEDADALAKITAESAAKQREADEKAEQARLAAEQAALEALKKANHGEVEQVYAPRDTAPPAPRYTVTYYYNNRPFAEQTATEGQTVSRPMLQPTANGVWVLETADGPVYDFNSPVTKNLKLVWDERLTISDQVQIGK